MVSPVRQIGFALLLLSAFGGAVALVGYISSHQKKLVAEPLKWMLLSPAEQEVERQKTRAKLRSWWPQFRKLAYASVVVLAVGVTLIAVG